MDACGLFEDNDDLYCRYTFFKEALRELRWAGSSLLKCVFYSLDLRG